MCNARLIHVVNYMPERIIKNDQFLNEILKENPDLLEDDKLLDNPFFKGVEQRHFASPDYTSSELGYQVAKKLLNETSTKETDIDLIVCSCIFTDTYWPGIGSNIQAKLGANQAAVINLDTSCCSFLTGLSTAQAFIRSGHYNKVMIISVTNFISRLDEFQKSPRSFVLGDGACAALMTKDSVNSIVSSHEQAFGENYGLMRFEPDLVDGYFYNYWQRSCGPITVNFDKKSLDKIRDNALKIVPNMLEICLIKANMKIEEINCLITHQPNQFFIKEWRKTLSMPNERCHDPLKKYGNLFQGSVAVTLADAFATKRIKPGDLVAMATFANGGDLGAAIILKT